MVKLYKARPEKLRAIGKSPPSSWRTDGDHVNTVCIGVSNFSVTFLERLLANTDVVPAVNQIELHA
jgi:glycerol 2-dehydrogenase (NADP+)